MSLKKSAQLMFFATATALIYIHMQMQIIDLAYKGKDKEKRVHELMDNNGSLTHQVLTLKSANHLGSEFLNKDDRMQFMGKDRVKVMTARKKSVVAKAVVGRNLLSLARSREVHAVGSSVD